MKARILAQYYADAGAFVTKEESRYSLDSLRLEPHPEKGVVIVATDGHTMGVFHDRGGECPAEGITLRFDSCLAEMCGAERTLEINDDGSASVLNRGREDVRFSRIESDGSFPAWRPALPKWTPEIERNDYNPEYLERCAKLAGHPYPHLAIWSGTDGTQVTHGKDRAAVVRPYERDDCFFLVMPMRRNDDAHWPKLIDALRLKDETDIVASSARVEAGTS
jgi:hypothetical protein